MTKVCVLSISLLLSLSQAIAQDSKPSFMLGYALSGPTVGIALTGRTSDKYSARIIYTGSDMFQGQLLYQANMDNEKHYIIGVGRLIETPFIRGAVGKKWYKGSWALSGEFGLNIPLDKKSDNGQGLAGALEALSYLILVGVGLHYDFR